MWRTFANNIVMRMYSLSFLCLLDDVLESAISYAQNRKLFWSCSQISVAQLEYTGHDWLFEVMLQGA